MYVNCISCMKGAKQIKYIIIMIIKVKNMHSDDKV